jgi:hypothetical protein
MTNFSNHQPDLAQDANNDNTSHLGGHPTNHYPTDDYRPVGTTTNETTNANFTDDTSHFSRRTTNHHPTDDDSYAIGTTNANIADTNNGTTNIAPNYASLLTLLATNPTDPTSETDSKVIFMGHEIVKLL